MKPTTNKTQSGSVLVISLVTCVLIGTVLGSCLTLISHRNRTAMRSTAWNSAIPVLEAGLEEALTHLHRDSNNPTTNDWTAETVDGKMVYWKYRDFPDGSHYYVTNFNFGTPSPMIRSAGYVPSPLAEDQFISRIVEVGTTNPPSVFNYAIAANGPVKFSGNAVVDGYDSSLGEGRYDPVTNRTASGGVATNSKEQKAIDVGSAHLYGKAVTGPGGGVSVSGGSVGDLTWAAGIQPGDWVNNDMNVQFQQNSAPTDQVFPWPPSVPVGTTNYTYLETGNYSSETLIVSINKPVIVKGQVTLYVKKDFVVASGNVYIEPGASLKLYVGGTAAINGVGVVNGTGSPANFSLYGLPTCTMVSYSGTANLVGTINAPQAAVNLSGGASLFGAVICNTFNSNGGSSVHYDKAAGYKGIFLVTSWREI